MEAFIEPLVQMIDDSVDTISVGERVLFRMTKIIFLSKI